MTSIVSNDALPFGTAIAEQESLRAIRIYCLKLPFRLRIGDSLFLNIEPDIDVVFRNYFKIPVNVTADSISDLVLENKDYQSDLLTDAYIIHYGPLLQGPFPANLDSLSSTFEAKYHETLTALNSAITAYLAATGLYIGLEIVSRLRITQYFDQLHHLVFSACVPNYRVTTHELDSMRHTFRQELISSWSGSQLHLDLEDAPHDTIQSIQKYIHLQHRYIFYQFATDSISKKLIEHDYLSALLFVVIALEAAHAAFLQLSLEKKLASVYPTSRELKNTAEKKASVLLQRLGFFEMLEITPLLFMDDKNKPSQEDIKACQQGITIRNSIMHAITKNGQYKLRNHNNAQLDTAHSSVHKIYQIFANLIERASDTYCG